MDVRDVYFWASEARRHRLVRRMDAYNAALLPHQEAATIRSAMDGLEADLEAIDQDPDEIARADKENERLIAEANRMIRARQEKRRAQRAAGIVSAPRKKQRPPRKGKVIR